MTLLLWNHCRRCRPIVVESPSCRRKGEFLLLYDKKFDVVVTVVGEEAEILHVEHEREGCIYRRWNLEGEIALWAKW